MGTESITKRELEIIKLVAEDLTSSQIGEKLGITEGTVNVHRSKIMAKLQVNDSERMLHVCYKENLITH